MAQQPHNPSDVPEDSTDTADDQSKSARKRNADAMKKLGLQLAELSAKQLSDMELPERLHKAITDYQRITSNGARRRQRGFMGSLLRDAGSEEVARIQARHSLLTEHDAHSKRIHHDLEIWRERLIDDDAALTEFLDQHPGTAAQELRTVIRRARTARNEDQRKIATRALYRKLSDIVQA